MKNLFHDSLIKIIVLHHLNKLDIAWENFIENDVFITPLPQPARKIPPPTSVSQRHTRSSRKVVVKKAKEAKEAKGVKETKKLKTYHRGPRQVFSPHIVEGAFPSSSINQVHQDKQQDETIVHE